MIRRFLRKIISALTNFLALAPVSLHTPQHNLGFRGNRLPVFFVERSRVEDELEALVSSNYSNKHHHHHHWNCTNTHKHLSQLIPN